MPKYLHLSPIKYLHLSPIKYLQYKARNLLETIRLLFMTVIVLLVLNVRILNSCCCHTASLQAVVLLERRSECVSSPALPSPPLPPPPPPFLKDSRVSQAIYIGQAEKLLDRGGKLNPRPLVCLWFATPMLCQPLI